MKSLSQHEFEQMWQVHGYAMLKMDLGVTFPFATTKYWLCSFNDKNWFFTYENNVGAMYYSKQEMKLAEYWGRHDFLNSEWLLAYIQKSEELYRRAGVLFKKYTSDYLKQLNKDDLYLTVREVGLTLSDVYAYFNACQPQCVAGLEKDLTAELGKSVPPEKIREVLLDLTRSEKRTMLDKEAVDWLKIYSKDYKGIQLDQVLDKHAKQYGILGTADDGKYYDVAYYRELYSKTDKAEARKELEGKMVETREIEKRKKRLMNDYELSDHAQRLADIIAVIGHNRFELRLRGWMPLDWWLSAILAPYIENRDGLSSALVYQMTFQELLQYLLTGYYDETELQRRKECVVGGMSAGQVFYRSGDEGRKLAAALVPTVDANIKQLEG